MLQLSYALVLPPKVNIRGQTAETRKQYLIILYLIFRILSTKGDKYKIMKVTGHLYQQGLQQSQLEITLIYLLKSFFQLAPFPPNSQGPNFCMVAVLVNISSRTVKWRALKQALIKTQQSLRQVGEFHCFLIHPGILTVFLLQSSFSNLTEFSP